MDDFLKNVSYNLASGLIVATFWFLWFYFVPRKKEGEWIATHGLLFYGYFRTVDWRCRKIFNHIRRDPEAMPPLDMTEHLIKLKADLDCLERMTELWSDRISAFPGWYVGASRKLTT